MVSSSRPVSDQTVEPASTTDVPRVPPVRVTWYFVTPVSSVAASQDTTTEVFVALARTLAGTLGALVSGPAAAHGSLAFAVTVVFFTVLVPVPRA